MQCYLQHFVTGVGDDVGDVEFVVFGVPVVGSPRVRWGFVGGGASCTGGVCVGGGGIVGSAVGLGLDVVVVVVDVFS